jgi:hypothetical protein
LPSLTAAEDAGAAGPPAGDEPAGAVPVVCAEAIPTASKAVHDHKYPVLIGFPCIKIRLATEITENTESQISVCSVISVAEIVS